MPKTVQDFITETGERFADHGLTIEAGFGHAVIKNEGGDPLDFKIVDCYALEDILQVLELQRGDSASELYMEKTDAAERNARA